jgi:hypothetical protein
MVHGCIIEFFTKVPQDSSGPARLVRRGIRQAWDDGRCMVITAADLDRERDLQQKKIVMNIIEKKGSSS